MSAAASSSVVLSYMQRHDDRVVERVLDADEDGHQEGEPIDEHQVDLGHGLARLGRMLSYTAYAVTRQCSGKAAFSTAVVPAHRYQKVSVTDMSELTEDIIIKACRKFAY